MEHAKVFATLIICLGLLIGAVVYAKRDYLFAAPTSPAQAAVTVDNLASNVQSTPADDWKKILTDSTVVNNPIQIVASANATTSEDDNTLTTQMAKNFFALYIQDKKDGVTIDQNEATNIANETINNLSAPSEAKQYTVADIKMIQDSSTTTLKTYEEAVTTIIKSDSLYKDINPITAVNTASQSGNDSDLAGLDLLIKDYQHVISDMLQVPVPAKIFAYHIVYLNTLSDILYDLQNMRQTLTDPATGYIGFTNFQKDIIAEGVIAQDLATNLP